MAEQIKEKNKGDNCLSLFVGIHQLLVCTCLPLTQINEKENEIEVISSPCVLNPMSTPKNDCTLLNVDFR